MSEQTATVAALERGRDFDVGGRVVLITGSGQGIGREYARQFAAAGAIPVIAELNREAAERVAAEIEAEGGEALAVATDVADPGSVDAAVGTVLERYGKVDVPVNNAAIFSTLKMRTFDQTPLEEWQRVVDVNLSGCFHAARAVVGPMREAGWGRIINISSGSVFVGSPNYLHYVASKSALMGMTRAMSRELGGDGITVITVQPGGTFTEIERETVSEEGKKRLIEMQAIHRPEVPTDLAGLVLFLATEASSFITGQAIAVVDGLTNR